MFLLDLFFNLKGRIGRLTYAIAQIPVALMNLATLASCVSGYNSGQAPVFSAFGLLIGIYAMNALSVKRLHDLDKSGWWMLLCMVPSVVSAVALVLLAVGKNNLSLLLLSLLLSIVSLGLSLWSFWILIKMLFFAGSKGSNTFGDPPGSGGHLLEVVDEKPIAEHPGASVPLTAPISKPDRTATVQSAGFGRRGTVRLA